MMVHRINSPVSVSMRLRIHLQRNFRRHPCAGRNKSRPAIVLRFAVSTGLAMPQVPRRKRSGSSVSTGHPASSWRVYPNSFSTARLTD